ncbi:MAG: hypothetical protein RJA70_2571 [Pseudomonadota bacterium]|jgi:short-subunit dehydrogenase
MSSIDFCDGWVLVTGASSGIGREFAVQLAKLGARLVLAARSRDRLVDLADTLGTPVKVVVADLSTRAGIDRLLADVDALELPIRHVVNNAGMGGAGHFARMDPDAIEAMTTLNSLAPILITRHFLPKLLEARAGGFIQVASTSSFLPIPYMATYGATKAYVLSFSVALLEEIQSSGVRVLSLCPGSVPTEFQERAGYTLHGPQSRSAISAEQVVREGLAAYVRGEEVLVPGRINALQMFAQRFVSLPLKAKAAALVMRRSGRDKVS